MSKLVQTLKAIGFVALFASEGAVCIIGDNIRKEGERFYDKRYQVEISKEAADSQINLGNILYGVGLGTMIITPSLGVYNLNKKKKESK